MGAAHGSAPPRPDAGELAELKRRVLDAGVGGAPLAPGGGPSALADLAMLRGQDGDVVLDPAGAEDVDLGGLAAPVRREPPSRTGGPFLRLRCDVTDAEHVLVALDAVLPDRQGTSPVGLGSLIARFVRDADGWRLADPPAQLAT